MTYPESIMKSARQIADRWADDENTEECAEAIAALVMAERERLVPALKPFVDRFEQCRQKYSRRYKDAELGFKNFDKMPDFWPMEMKYFDMGTYRRAAAAIRSQS